MNERRVNGKFAYTYSAKIQREIERIYEKYALKKTPPEGERKLDELRRIDRQAERPGKAVLWTALAAGVALFGWGMSMVLTMSEGRFIPGAVLGVAGFALVCAAVPLGRRVASGRREKFAPRILRLAEELGAKWKENNNKGE